MSDSVINQAVSTRDRYSALLRDCLKALGPDTVDRWLVDLEKTLLDPDIDTGDRLEAHAMLVGVLTVMCESIDAANGGAA